MAETIRLAVWNAGLTRRGPGLLLRDIEGGTDPQVGAVVRVLAALDADVLLLTGIDWDYEGAALAALADRLARAGAPYPHRFAPRPNTGMATGLDLDGNGRRGEPRDAQGYGRFAGAGGMALLSRLPLGEGARDFTAMPWRDLPGQLMPEGTDPAVAEAQRLSTTAHWDVPLALPGGGALRVLAWAATPPVFDGPEDRNGRRNHDEAAFWLRLLDGDLPGQAPPPAPYVLMGQAGLDPVDGDGRAQAIRALLADPRLQDPAPRAAWDVPADPGQRGDPALDTAVYPKGVGGLRVDYVLPSAGLAVTGAGVLRPAPGDALAADAAAASRHFPVWVDLALP